jgi:hypothetical protein
MSGAPKEGWKLIRDSFSKLIVWFKDGNVRTFYSIDWKHRHSKQRDQNIGIARLRKKLSEWGNKADGAEIYDKASGNSIAKFYEGKEIPPNEND